MASRSVKHTARGGREVADPAQQPVTLERKTIIKGFSPERELTCLIEGGEWELVPQATAFRKRSPEGQVQALCRALDQRIDQLGKSLNYLVNRGPRQRQAAMNLLQQMRGLATLRDEVLQEFYSKGRAAIPEQVGSSEILF